MSKKARKYNAVLVEILETLCDICLYLEKDSRHTHNPNGDHMAKHFNALKKLSKDISPWCYKEGD